MAAVAQAAGVSRSTVSKALRNDPTIPARTCLRIQKLAAELGYRPNPLVSALMAQLHGACSTTYSPVIACLDAWPKGLRSVQSRTFDAYQEGARQRAESLGYTLELFRLDPRPRHAQRLWRALGNRNVAGILVPPVPREQTCLQGDWSKFAAATVGFSLREPRLHRACAHYYQNMDLALTQLTGQGFMRIGFCISSKLGARVAHAWLGEYCAWSHCNGMCMKPFIDSREDQDDFFSWLGEVQPQAVICLETWIYAPLIKEFCQSQGSHIQIFSLGYNSARSAFPGVDQQSRRVGSAAIDLIIAQLHRNERGVPVHPKTVLIEGAWREADALPQQVSSPALVPASASELEA